MAKGYKVGRVEQTETPDQMQERCKLGGWCCVGSVVVGLVVLMELLVLMGLLVVVSVVMVELMRLFLPIFIVVGTFHHRNHLHFHLYYHLPPPPPLLLGKLPSKEKVVRREVCSVQSRGTKRSSFLDGECGGSGSNNFLLAISELVRLIDLPVCLVRCLSVGLNGWLFRWLIGWLVRRLVGWLSGWIVRWLVGWLAGWLDCCWIVGWLVVLLDGWFVGWGINDCITHQL